MDHRIMEETVRLAGASAWGIIPTMDIPFSEEVRKICQGNICHGYGKSWACPPGVGSYEECYAFENRNRKEQE